MEPLLNNGICRCCASEGSFKDFLTSYHWMGEEEVYADMLKDCFSISLSVSEDYSNGGICEVCITHLRNACNFKRQVLQTEEHFKRQVQGILLKSNPIKIEPVRDEGEQSDQNMSDDFSTNDYEMPLKMEKVDEKPKKRQAKASTSRTKKTKTAEGEPSAKRQKDIINESEEEPEDIKKKVKETKSNTLKKNRSPKKKADEKCMQEVEKHRKNFIEVITYSNATPIRFKGDIGYGCYFCSEQYPEAADLKLHTITKHDNDSIVQVVKDMRIYTVKLDITGLQCCVCQLDISTIEELMNHLIKEHQRVIYVDIKNHMVPFKFENEDLKCAICLAKFMKFRNLTEHMNTHYRNYVCDVCGAGFVNRDILRSHLRIHKIGNFTCDFCTKTFNTLVKKQSHINIVHKKLYMTRKCGYCNEHFDDYHKKNEHLTKFHGVNLVILKCDLCDKTFINQNRFRRHVRKDHLMERNHECELCDMKFFSGENLKKHLRTHTGQKDYHCSICTKSFARKFSLKKHLRTHSKNSEGRKTCKGTPDAFLIIKEPDLVTDRVG